MAIVPTLAAALERRAPRDDVDYLTAYARMLFTIALTVGTLVYIANGGRLVRLAPTP